MAFVGMEKSARRRRIRGDGTPLDNIFDIVMVV
jgi:hypothetical protein